MCFTQPAVNGLRINHTESSWYAWNSQKRDFWLTKQNQFFNSPETFPTTYACQKQIRTIAPFCPWKYITHGSFFNRAHKSQEAVYTVIILVLVFFKVNIIHILLSNKVFLKVCVICSPETPFLGMSLFWKCKSCSLRAQKGMKALRPEKLITAISFPILVRDLRDLP